MSNNIKKVEAIMLKIESLRKEVESLETQAKNKMLEVTQLADEAKILLKNEINSNINSLLAALKEEDKEKSTLNNKLN
jgi:hypothetical protein